MKKIAALAVLVAVTISAIVFGMASAQAADTRPFWQSVRCDTETSTNCFYDATQQGNGTGRSFYAVRVRGEDCVLYWDRAYARENNFCVSR